MSENDCSVNSCPENMTSRGIALDTIVGQKAVGERSHERDW